LMVRPGWTVTYTAADDDGLVMFMSKAKELECSVHEGHEAIGMIAIAASFTRRVWFRLALRTHGSRDDCSVSWRCTIFSDEEFRLNCWL
jgi:hypothetical protein